MAEPIKIIKSLIAFAGIFLLSQSLSGQGLVFNQVKDSNRLIEKFYFKIINTSDESESYSVSLQKFTREKGWFEISQDVFYYGPEKKNRVFTLVKRSAREHFVSPDRLIKMPTLGNVRYRLKLTYRNSEDGVKSVSYSNNFVFFI